jgi:hypothetical protein
MNTPSDICKIVGNKIANSFYNLPQYGNAGSATNNGGLITTPAGLGIYTPANIIYDSFGFIQDFFPGFPGFQYFGTSPRWFKIAATIYMRPVGLTSTISVRINQTSYTSQLFSARTLQIGPIYHWFYLTMIRLLQPNDFLTLEVTYFDVPVSIQILSHNVVIYPI